MNAPAFPVGRPDRTRHANHTAWSRKTMDEAHSIAASDARLRANMELTNRTFVARLHAELTMMERRNRQAVRP